MKEGTAKILIVEDDVNTCNMLSRIIKHFGYDCHYVKNGEDCISYIENHEVDLVFLDYFLPGINGLDVLKTIRKKYSNLELPIIMATSLDNTSDIVEVLKFGANDYITKPFNKKIILARIKTQIDLVHYYLLKLEHKETEALNSMIITYNHEINDPLTIIRDFFSSAYAQEITFEKEKKAADRIAEVLKKIEEVTLSSISYTEYFENSKKIDISNMICVRNTKKE